MKNLSLIIVGLLLMSFAAAPWAGAQETAADEQLVEIELDLPKPAFRGTPKELPPGVDDTNEREPFMAPPGVTLISADKPVTCSDEDPLIGEQEMITDQDKEAMDCSYVEFGPGLQYVQVDLEQAQELYGILVWHYHSDPRVYHDVIVQVADDEDFIANVRTLFNNDHDNSAGLGVGEEKEYFEDNQGRLVLAEGTTAQYVRLYSYGSTADDLNHYVEVEVYGRAPQ